MIYQRSVFFGTVLLFALLFSLAQSGSTAQSSPLAQSDSLAQVHAESAMRPDILAAFNTAYPDSASSGAGCQVCHVNAGGGPPWNAYGWSIREQTTNGISAADAIAAVENLDADENGESNLEEITAGSMPGWTEGAVHTSYSVGSTLENQEPPTLSVDLDITVAITETPVITNPGTSPLPPITATVPYDEDVDGDLSDNPMVPHQFILSAGDNFITATSVAGDREYFSLIVPAGTVLESIVLNSYESVDDQSFMAVQNGAIFTETPTDTVAANLLGYVIFGTASNHVGTDILDDMGAAPDAAGFTAPLPSGTYIIWSQETGTDPSTYALNFVVANAAPKLFVPVMVNQTP